jgi:hypothetical protein
MLKRCSDSFSRLEFRLSQMISPPPRRSNFPWVTRELDPATHAPRIAQGTMLVQHDLTTAMHLRLDEAKRHLATPLSEADCVMMCGLIPEPKWSAIKSRSGHTGTAPNVRSNKIWTTHDSTLTTPIHQRRWPRSNRWPPLRSFASPRLSYLHRLNR